MAELVDVELESDVVAAAYGHLVEVGYMFVHLADIVLVRECVVYALV